MTELEFEKTIKTKFIDAGWDIDDNYHESFFRPDIALYHDKKLFGFVEVIMYREGNEKFLLKKLEQISHIAKEIKPIIFVVTDGVRYHVSIKGKPFEVIHFAPGPFSYYAVMGLIEEYVDFYDNKEDKHND